MRRAPAYAAAVALFALTFALAGSLTAHERGIPAAEIRSGKTFLSRNLQADQDDPAANLGLLWVDQGAELWRTPAGTEGKSCGTCHGEPAAMKGVATRYPAFDAALGRLMNLETRIQNCRTTHQSGAPSLAYESQELLALTTLVTYQSRGLPMSVAIDGPAQEAFARGEQRFHRPQGQLGISCAQCHVENWGKRMRGDTVSQGYATGFPAYRLEWETLGSSHRRLRACFNGVRAEPFPPGSPEFIELELYLAWRADRLPIETPALRR